MRQALVGVDDGTFARALGGKFEPRLFNAGPAAMEALLVGDLDASYVGAGPAVIAWFRSEGGLRVVAGAVSGGAVLVVRDARSAADLVGKRVGSPQLGNTQDVALRTWLRAQGLSDRGGDRGVEVTPLSNADNLAMFAPGRARGRVGARALGRAARRRGGREDPRRREDALGGRPVPDHRARRARAAPSSGGRRTWRRSSGPTSS